VIRAGTRRELDGGAVRTVPLGRDHDGIPREAIVLLDADGEVRAFVNRCRHLPIPLDGGSRRFLDESTGLLLCGTHGALYRIEDGYCVSGPCRGLSLLPLEVRIDASGAIWISDAIRSAAGEE
jgi:nitrite reductase/ring-hydroxylating ferredoxin subunit